MFGHVLSPPAGLDGAGPGEQPGVGAWRPTPGPHKQEDLPLTKEKNVVPAAADAKGKKGPAEDETDHELEGLMSEIETDLRTDEFKKMWKAYGNAITLVVVLFLVGVTGFQLYRQYEARQHEEAARQYELAIEAGQDAANADKAIAQFGALIKEGDRGYTALARLSQASLQLEKKDVDGAIANYKALAADEKADPVLRDLGTLLSVLHSIDRADAKVLEAMLTPLTSPTNAFNLSAMELSALLAAKQGDTARALKTLQQISVDPRTPQAMRDRVADLTKLYEVGTIPPPPAAPATPAAAPAPAKSPAAPAQPAAAPAKP